MVPPPALYSGGGCRFCVLWVEEERCKALEVSSMLNSRIFRELSFMNVVALRRGECRAVRDGEDDIMWSCMGVNKGVCLEDDLEITICNC